ncbi:MAG: PD-(D/E)XK nuclease family protein [Myxococcales bacterium]|nr:PD-(D/E)XK nuclease family protein [Myxococcota bacterium]MDW8280614.1 PD-(D/E)XK nuclease family protein [Myxococcales bacterium]
MVRIQTRADRASFGLSALGGCAADLAFSDDLILDELVEEGWTRAEGRPERLGPIGETLLLTMVTLEAEGPLVGLRAQRGLRRTLRDLVRAAGVAGLPPGVVRRLLGRLGAKLPTSASRLKELGRLNARYHALLGPRLADEARAWRCGLQGLAARPPQGDAFEVHGLWLAPEGEDVPGQHGRMLLLPALGAGVVDPWRAGEGPRRVLMRVILPSVEGRPALEAALRPLEEALYRLHALNVEEERVPLGDPATPWGRFLESLFRPAGAPPLLAPGELPAERLSFLSAPTPALEARTVARQVRDLVDQGVPPAGIVIAAEQPASRSLLLAALRRYGIPVYGPVVHDGEVDPALSLDYAPPVQAVLALYGLIQQGVPREPFLQALGSAYLRWGGSAPPWLVARALRESGVRYLRPQSSADEAGEPDHHRRLREWVRQQGSLRLPPHPSNGAGHPDTLQALQETIEPALTLLAQLPAEATVAGHVRALQRLWDRLQVDISARACAAPPPAVELDDTAALGRDQEAVRSLKHVLEELVRSTARLSLQQRRLPRDRFAAILGAALQRRRLRPRGVAGAGVVVTDLAGAAGRRCLHLFVTGLVDGQIPRRTPEDPLFPDDERAAFNHLLGQDVLPLAQDKDRLCPLWLVAALSEAHAAHLSWPRADEEGRPLLRSPYVAEVLRAAGWPEPAPEPLLVVPEVAAARTVHELWMRAALDLHGMPIVSTGPGRRAAAAALAAALGHHQPERAARLAALIEMERMRLEWFTARLRAGSPEAEAWAGPFVGRLRDPELRQRLQVHLPGSPEHPLSASALEDYARCPFRFFVRRLLRAEPIAEGGDDLDALARGRLHHKALEAFFKERLAAGRLPLRADAEDRAALDQAIDQVLQDWPLHERTGHRDLFAVHAQRLRDDLWRLVQQEARDPPDRALVPRLFEHPFGPLAISSPGEQGEMPLHIHGVIDRVDVGPGRALILDYKTGRLERYEHILRHDLLVTSFQLPLYAAALRSDPVLAELGPGPVEVRARYYSLRSARTTRAELADQELISLDPQVVARARERNVAEVSYRLWRRLRDGDFRVDPKSCEGCGLEAACRVVLLPPREDGLDEEPRQEVAASREMAG